ncbi:M23 family metallopeptidase [Nocardia sp. NPDC051570]|uniref:M23 family metallopeptidase n=1 Tax=Nocardia sp. NPDC051570 TaxID=3364324 RepID=UPI0037AFC5C5
MRWPILILLTWLALPIVLPAPAAEAAPVGRFDWPLHPRPPVLRRFDKPAHDWLPGHRGVDLGGAAGQSVLAAGDGIAAFAAEVAGKPVVSIDHPGGLRTTYEPVRATVLAGRRVLRGEVVGTLEPGHPSCPDVCLHWGLRRDHDYLDPLGLLHTAPLRLKPLENSLTRPRLDSNR